MAKHDDSRTTRSVFILTYRKLSRTALGLAVTSCLGFVLPAAEICAQVLTIDTSGRTGPTVTGAPVERQYQQIEPTHVDLSATPLDPKTRLAIIRTMQAEQGFAMRPMPRGHKGLVLAANGKLEPAGEAYVNMVVGNGLSCKPGARVVVTDVRIDKDRIVFDLNGGPDATHRFLRHISVGTDPYYDVPVVADNGDPVGSRITLTFKGRVPELTGPQVKALLAPLVTFDVKTPVQAYTDTLPPPLKKAILDHQVLVGMSTDMVMFAKGLPQDKIREMDGQMPIEIWLYGKAPEDVTFVRINGNRVIRVEIARVGKPVQVFDTDVVSAMLMGSGMTEQAENVRVIKEGDVHRDPDRQAPAPPPTLRNPGESLPDNQNSGEMKPVHFPKQTPENQPGANPDDQPPAQAQPANGAPPAPGSTGKQGSAPSSAPANPDAPDTSGGSN